MFVSFFVLLLEPRNGEKGIIIIKGSSPEWRLCGFYNGHLIRFLHQSPIVVVIVRHVRVEVHLTVIVVVAHLVLWVSQQGRRAVVRIMIFCGMKYVCYYYLWAGIDLMC